jgi:hypothetical protein
MKKLLVGIVVLGIYGTAKSQVYVQGGVNLANITSTSSGNTEDNNMLTTFNAGLLGRFGLSNTIDLESGVLVSGKGSKAETYFTSGGTENYIKTRFNPIYLEVPLNLVIRVPLQGRSGLFFHGGPYAAIGVAGNAESESKILGVVTTEKSDIKFSNDDPTTSAQEDAGYDKLKRFDLGANLGAGFDFGRFMLKANYGHGFTKINSTESNNSADDKNKYRTISLSVGIPLSR